MAKQETIILGRSKEQKILKELFSSKRSEFIAIYGRRRVGKTYLIKNLVDSLPYVFFHVTGIQEGSLQEQLEEFAKQIGITFYQGAPVTPRKRWLDAFEDLTQAIKQNSKK